jgi:hypothetical protein
MRTIKTEVDLLAISKDVRLFVGKSSKKIARIESAIKGRLATERSVVARRLQKLPVGYVVRITDYSNYEAGNCSDGGSYSFSTDFVKNEEWKWVVEYGSSCTGFSYCSYYGTFCSDDCDEKCPSRGYTVLETKDVAFQLCEAGGNEVVEYVGTR